MALKQGRRNGGGGGGGAEAPPPSLYLYRNSDKYTDIRHFMYSLSSHNPCL